MYDHGWGWNQRQQTNGVSDWKSMVLRLIREIAKDCIPNADHYVEQYLGLLFNETFFQLMSQTLSEHQTVSAIKACLETREVSSIH